MCRSRTARSTTRDPAAGIALAFDRVNASVDAPSLAGPWHVDGSYLDGGKAVPFRIATGRRLEDGTIRVKVDFSPTGLPVDASADGVLAENAGAGLTYVGTYAVTEVVDAAASAPDDSQPAADEPPVGWNSQGSFALSRDGLVIDKAVLANGPADRQTGFAGSLTIRFGMEPSFDAVVESKQIDVDRSFGGGPNAPINVAEKTQELVGWLANVPQPPVPGRIRFTVPAVVAGGGVIQNVGFEASPAGAGWQIKGFHAELPGQAQVSADGLLTTAKAVGFNGTASLAVVQPAAFAAWWRGASGGGGQLLPAFDISGRADIAPGRVQVSGIQARIGDATVTGSFGWGADQRTNTRTLGAKLQADRIDVEQVKALADLLVGRQLTDARAIADSFAVELTADVFRYQDVLLKGIRVNARYADDVLNVVQFGIDDIGGASFKITSGRIEGLTSKTPRGRLDAHFEAKDPDGLALTVGRLAPGSDLSSWIDRTAQTLTPLVIDAHVIAPPTPGGTGLSIALSGVAGPTTITASAQTSKEIANWRSADTTFDVFLESPDSAALARQIGFAATTVENDPGGEVHVHGAGIPDGGLDTSLDAQFAGVRATATGKLAVGITKPPTFDGTFTLAADDLDPLIATAGLSIPGAATGTKLDLGGSIGVADGTARLTWKNGTVGDRAVSGTFSLGRGSGQTWLVGGDLSVDAVDLDWLMSLGLGFGPMPTGKPDEPWSKAPFGPPTYGAVRGKITVATGHFTIGDTIDVANGTLNVDLQPQRIAAELTGGQLAGGTAAGTVAIANVDGNANLNASFDLGGASLQSFIWQRDGRAVATGAFDLKGSFEATGRTPAGLVSSATGGGVITIRDGEARYVNPNTARLIVRASDLGQEYTDTELAKALADNIDADSFKFGEAGAAFSMAAGAVRIKDMSVRSPDLDASGDTVIDFNALTLDSDWTLKFNPGDDKVQGTDPKVGLVFSGPLADPSRRIDPLPFSSYLNSRRAARMLEIIATEEADRAERDRLGRLVVKLKQDDERARRVAAAAAEKARLQAEITAAAAQAIADAHVAREAAAEQRQAEALKRAVARSEAALAAARKVAAETADRATAARAKADDAQAALAEAVTADQQAQAALAESARALAAAQSASDAAKATASDEIAKADAAEKVALDAQATEASARDAASKANADLDAANAAYADASAKADDAVAAAAEATREAGVAKAALMDADQALGEAARARETAVATRKASEMAFSATTSSAEQAATAAAQAASAADAAAKERDVARAAAETATADADQTVVERDAAEQAFKSAEQDSEKVDAQLAAAQQAADEALALAANPPDGADTASAQAMVNAAELRLSGAEARAVHAKQILDATRRAYNNAAAAAGDAADRAAAAQASFADASAKFEAADAEAKRTAEANATAQANLEAATEARDAAVARAAAAEAAAQQAGTTFNDAQTSSHDAYDRATAANQAADAATLERAAAARRVAAATSAANAAAFALKSATDATDAAIAEALSTRKIADEANAKAVAAASSLASVRADNETAAAAADSAAKARADAEAVAADAEAKARAAEADAAAAVADVKVRADEALAAKRRAGLAPAPDQAAADQAPPAKPPAAKPVKPKLPKTIAGDQPIVITPPYH